MKIKTMSRKMLLLYTLLVLAVTLFSCAELTKWGAAHTPPDDTCAHCHYAIYKDWKIAYRPYNEAARKEDYELVHSRPMSGADVRMQKSHKEGKGECSECHIVQQPQEILTISKLDVSFKDTVYQVCGRCHEKTFNEWLGSRFFREEVSCLICHTDTRDKPVEEKEGDFHSSQGLKGADLNIMSPSLMLERLKKAVDVAEDVWIDKGKINVLLIVNNRGVGHNLPTDAINASLLIRVALVDSKGQVVKSKERVVGGAGKMSIPPGREAYFDFDMGTPPAGRYVLEISLDHSDRERKTSDERITLLKKSVPLTIK